MEFYLEKPKSIPIIQCDVLVAGGGTGGVFAAIAAARNGAKTILVELKGYPGGIVVEGPRVYGGMTLPVELIMKEIHDALGLEYDLQL